MRTSLILLLALLGATLPALAPAQSADPAPDTNPGPRADSWKKPTRLPLAEDARFGIGKVVDFVNDQDVQITKGDRSLDFDKKYHNFGAVTSDQVKAKKGHYWYVFWKGEGSQKATIRFEYRQKKSRDRVFRLDVPYDNPAGSHQSNFEVVGQAYEVQGVVVAWRAMIIQGGKIVAQKKSMTWE